MESGFSFSETLQQCKLGMILFLYTYCLVSTMPLMTHNLKLCKPNRNTTPSVFVLFILCLKSNVENQIHLEVGGIRTPFPNFTSFLDSETSEPTVKECQNECQTNKTSHNIPKAHSHLNEIS